MGKHVEVNDITFQAAVDNAGYWARRHVFKKMTKVIYGIQWKPSKKNPKKLEAFVTTRPPKDAEAYVQAFVNHYCPEVPDEQEAPPVSEV